MPLSETLRDETRDEHRNLERLPFARALLTGSLPLSGYLAFLEALAVVHEALEVEASSSPDRRVLAVWRETMRKLPLLQSDLEALGAGAESPPPSLEALVLADEIRSRAASDPVALLGFLYVLEGATLGGSILRPAVAAAYDLETEGLAYLSSYGEGVHESWLDFKDRLDDASLSEEELERVLDSARASFEHLGLVLRELEPARGAEPTRDRVRTLNPIAGSHPIGADPLELKAALLAGAETWKSFPYLHARYGERGRAFTRSDTGWIVYLLDSSEATLQSQLDWLAGLLSPRGVPRWVLEVHLGNVERALARAFPDRESRYRPLGRARERLARARRAILPEARFQELAARFDERVGPDWARRLPGTGAVLVSAVLDAHESTPRPIESLGWLREVESFDERWVEAVEATIRGALGEIGSGRRRRARE